MPVVSVFMNDGDPTVQASGEYRGTVNVELTDGRVITRSLRAPDEDAWSALILDIESKTLKEVQDEDAKDGIGDEDVAAKGEASIEQRALAYLRTAMEQDTAYEAYKLMNRFDRFRQAKGWSWKQVISGLQSVGLEQEELDEMTAAYQGLTGGGRPAIMAQAFTIQENWENR